MDIIINIILCAIVVTVGVGIINLGESEAYHCKVNGILKNIIALVLGSISSIFFSSFINILYSISNWFIYGEGVIGYIMQLVSRVAGIGGCIAAGIVVYYSLCNTSIWGNRIAYVLYAALSLVCIFDVYYLFVNGVILDGVLYIVSISVGLAILIHESNKIKIKMDEEVICLESQTTKEECKE
ncbi:MAG: hypothetical protein EOM76_09905 [Sphingobacteriia bacterium]|nr:hypothetical protein [Sphingobacteriia bacterium]